MQFWSIPVLWNCNLVSFLLYLVPNTPSSLSLVYLQMQHCNFWFAYYFFSLIVHALECHSNVIDFNSIICLIYSSVPSQSNKQVSETLVLPQNAYNYFNIHCYWWIISIFVIFVSSRKVDSFIYCSGVLWSNLRSSSPCVS